jgi:hypothetical protein
MADERKQPPCPDCGCPIDLHLRPGDHDRGGCYMLKRPKPDVLRVERCTCVRTPDTFLSVAR